MYAQDIRLEVICTNMFQHFRGNSRLGKAGQGGILGGAQYQAHTKFPRRVSTALGNLVGTEYPMKFEYPRKSEYSRIAGMY